MILFLFIYLKVQDWRGQRFFVWEWERTVEKFYNRATLEWYSGQQPKQGKRKNAHTRTKQKIHPWKRYFECVALQGKTYSHCILIKATLILELLLLWKTLNLQYVYSQHANLCFFDIQHAIFAIQFWFYCCFSGASLNHELRTLIRAFQTSFCFWVPESLRVYLSDLQG